MQTFARNSIYEFRSSNTNQVKKLLFYSIIVKVQIYKVFRSTTELQIYCPGLFGKLMQLLWQKDQKLTFFPPVKRYKRDSRMKFQ